MTPSDKQKIALLAKALADFWSGGEGPSHGQEDAFAIAGVAPEEGSKRDRAGNAVRSVDDENLFTLVHQLVELLRYQYLPHSAPDQLKPLLNALRPYGFKLSDDFELTSTAHPDLGSLPDLPELREHVGRLQRALRARDDAQLLGSTKELLETTAKVVLKRTDQAFPRKFPGLITAALEALHLHPKSAHVEGSAAGPVRQILGGVLQIALGIDELRNTHGTGHGRVGGQARLSARHARLAAGAGITVATLMPDTLRTAQLRGGGPMSVSPGLVAELTASCLYDGPSQRGCSSVG